MGPELVFDWMDRARSTAYSPIDVSLSATAQFQGLEGAAGPGPAA